MTCLEISGNFPPVFVNVLFEDPLSMCHWCLCSAVIINAKKDYYIQKVNVSLTTELPSYRLAHTKTHLRGLKPEGRSPQL